VDAGNYPYNDSFKGHIPGIEGPCEDNAIYLLQTLRELDELAIQVDDALRDGCKPITEIDHTIKCETVIFYGFYMGGTGWKEWHNVRLVPGLTGLAVLPKGARTRGFNLFGGKVLAKVA
jgi:hypothetical protein